MISDTNSGSLDQYKFNSKSAIQYKLSSRLNEISGLTSSGNRVYAITDEVGKIYEINTNNGKIIKKFFLGSWTAEADFEGITLINNIFAAVASNGNLYFFKEGEDGASVDYRIIKTGLKAKNNIEGLCYDKKTNSLLLACKDYPGKDYDNTRTVYSFSLKSEELEKEPRFVISLKELKNDFGIKNFHPSGIIGSSSGDSFYILYSKGGPGIVEVSVDGKIIRSVELKKKLHRQPEGITIIEDDVIVVADEGAGKRAAITKYYPVKN